MSTETLAKKLGTTSHLSGLLIKARRLGMETPEALESLAVARGCWHYKHAEMVPAPDVSEEQFSNEELAMALLSPCQLYSPHTIRVGAAMLGAIGNDPESLAWLTVAERCEQQVRYIARAAIGFEPENSFWPHLLALLPDMPEMKDGIMPHPTRFVSMTGMTRAGTQRVTVWIRPRATLALAHG
ncbi:MAG TPA: hypothetical protein VK846_01130 [Candidatus Limnocylindria bacterium]|nr:hypothetical protein [Candidatus Limnocylindria bacterium]